MRDDIRDVLRSAAVTPRREIHMPELRARARRSRVWRMAAVAGSAAVLTAAVVGTVTTVTRGNGGLSPAAPTATDPQTPESDDPSTTPSDEDPSEPRDLDWPDPFVPPTTTSGERDHMPVTLADHTSFTLSYPSDLRLAGRGVQATVSYTFDEARPNAPHDVLFIPGEAPEGLLHPEALETYESAPLAPTLYEVAYEHLRGDPPYGLVYDAGEWTIVATIPRRQDADVVAGSLHPSVAANGWPTISASGPVELSEFFGEARGPQLEIGDDNPLFDVADAGEDFRYIVMGLSKCQSDEGVDRLGGDWYASKCLQLAGDRNIVVSIYGPEEFVRAVYEGLSLEE